MKVEIFVCDNEVDYPIFLRSILGTDESFFTTKYMFNARNRH